MYLHLGGNCVIDQNDILAILNIDILDKSRINYSNLDVSINKPYNLNDIEEKKRKSIIITTKGYYYSPISSIVLMKRSKSQFLFENS